MYFTRSKNEYAIYLDKVYTLALKQLEYGSNSLIKKDPSIVFAPAQQGWQIFSSGLELVVDNYVSIPNKYYLEVAYRLNVLTRTIIAANWSPVRGNYYYFWYDATAGKLKFTYQQGINQETLVIGNYLENQDNFLGLYSDLQNAYIYLNGQKVTLPSFSVKQLFNLDFSFNKKVNNLSNTGSELILKSFYLKEVRQDPANYTPSVLELGNENYQFNLEKQKSRFISAVKYLPSPRIGLAYFPSIVNIEESIELQTKSLSLFIDAAIPILATIPLETKSLNLNNYNATVGNIISGNIATESISLSAEAFIIPNTFADVELTTESLSLSSDVTVQYPIEISADINTASLTLSAQLSSTSEYNFDASNFFAALTATYTNDEKQLISNFYDDIQAAGIYQKLDELYLPFIGKNEHDQKLSIISFSSLNAVGSVYHRLGHSLSVQPYVLISAGRYGVFTTNKPINSLNHYQQDSASLFIGIHKISLPGDGHIFSTYSNTNNTAFSTLRYASNNYNAMVNSTFPSSQLNYANTANITTNVNMLATRESSTTQRLYVNGAQVSSSSHASVPININHDHVIGEFETFRPAGSIPSIFSRPTSLSFYYAGLGGNLTSSEFETLIGYIDELRNDLKQVQSTEITVTKSFADFNDYNDIFYHIGTQNLRKGYQNPAYFGDVKVIPGSLFVHSGSFDLTLSRYFPSHFSSYIYTNSASPWVTYDLGDNYKVKPSSYSLQARPDASLNFPRHWKLQGSNDNSTWTDLDTRTSDTSLDARSAWANFSATSSEFYRYIRILGTSTVDSNNAGILGFSQFRLYGDLRYHERPYTTTSFSQVFTRSFNGDTNGIIYYLGTGQNSQSNFGNPQIQGNLKIYPSSSHYNINDPFNTTLGIESLTNRLDNFTQTDTQNIPNSFYVVDFNPYRVVLSEYTIKSGTYSAWFLRNWKIQGSNNGYTWVDIDTRTSDTTLNAPNTWGNWSVSTSTAYQFIRILQTGVNSSGDHTLYLGEVEFYGTLQGEVIS